MKKLLLALLLLTSAVSVLADELTLKVTKRYMNVPIYSAERRKTPRRSFKMVVEGDTIGVFSVPFAAPDNVSFYSAIDMSQYKGKELTLCIDGEDNDLSRVLFSNRIIEELQRDKSPAAPFLSTSRLA